MAYLRHWLWNNSPQYLGAFFQYAVYVLNHQLTQGAGYPIAEMCNAHFTEYKIEPRDPLVEFLPPIPMMLPD